MQDTVVHNVKALNSQITTLVSQHDLLVNLFSTINGKKVYCKGAATFSNCMNQDQGLWKYMKVKEASKSDSTTSTQQHDTLLALSHIEASTASFESVLAQLEILDGAHSGEPCTSSSSVLGAPAPVVDLALASPTATKYATEIQDLVAQCDLLSVRSARVMQVLLEDIVVPESQEWVEINEELREIEMQVRRKEVAERDRRRYQPAPEVD